MKLRSLFMILLLVVMITGPAPAPAQDKEAEVQIKATHVAGKVYMLAGAGVNAGATVGRDGILIVDDSYEPLAGKFEAAFKNLNPGDLKYVVNTHYHGDHVGANPVFGKIATIIAHANVRKRVATPQEIMGHEVEPLEEAGWPVITFEKSLSIHFNGEEIEVTHFKPGHTDGDAFVYFTKSNVLVMGDHLFSGMFPFVDLGAGGTVGGYLENLKMVIDKYPADVKIIPGHGPLSTVDDVREMAEMIESTVAIVREQMKEGKSPEEIKEKGLPEKWASYDWRFIPTNVWIDTIYENYSK